tara:strand:+ start:180 stop:605 length:426 start_codon:yes stop_codon:yes gene_type:complete
MIKVKLLNEDSIMPTRGSEHSAGLDLYSSVDAIVHVGCSATIKTGIAVDVDHGNVGLIWPRSKLGAKFNIQVLAGVIDADYRGEVMVALLNSGDEPFMIKKGDRITQLIVQSCDMSTPVEVKELDETWRGNKGVNCDDLRL